ncbi:5-oxoprolinase subunit PxpA [Deinococcus cellulosilyticus]|uniref:UPF0271 protein n=1 Tax=Deinococcus cellulosilyticus (strain DSM 18568 / NBRC 106333 / KACC 11606 / 5516J-15) TaxID=1223518 RepID=A0A511N3I7_DEIC1|nr:5-oxoprolinase subunit PxpA [Deinococcus cellulosilyticus]GEM47435.1 UPF0271 protein [Deinococcus cellulosilyticus NBRC 106333 = KACC 11606]
MDLNCDLGEEAPFDRELMPLITSANIACGFHAGNPSLIRETAMLCLDHGVHIGAHPGFLDRENFGRLEQPVTPQEVYDLVTFQVAGMLGILNPLDLPLHHVKLHGALYNQTARDLKLARAAVHGILEQHQDVIFYGLAGSAHIQAAREIGMQVHQEAFLDRTYQDDGTLTPRSHPRALHESTEAALRQALEIASGSVTTLSGKTIPLHADTLCVHGDGPHALDFARELRATFQSRGIGIGS